MNRSTRAQDCETTAYYRERYPTIPSTWVFLQTHKLYGLQYLLASLFGAVTPFFILSGWLFNAIL